ncbi:hypothetical protein [Spartinivicinus poritis]|uniref:Uncharacterized protein n=1 Tax=Spartinivicinus poritis TaxID=2994640 RepID=A0ABT5U847_9GAMM|nr:hypothetical protein [Spartinivicinus sp. A2-2]MDE1462561.1 hypothetical protein [Spartinivicinus sp. A2-2]
MQLRIIDRSLKDADTCSIQLILETEGWSDSYIIEDYSSPIPQAFHDTLNWYFKDYPQLMTKSPHDRGVVEKLINYGQYIGDQCLGEQDEIYRFIAKIDAYKCENLHVRIESSRRQFFNELWEAIIFPEIPYFLAAVTKSFIRQFTDTSSVKDLPDLHYQLEYTPSTTNTLSSLVSDKPTEAATKPTAENKPLRILHLVYDDDSYAHHAFNTSLTLSDTQGAIHYEIFPIQQWDQLSLTSPTPDTGFHIVHIDSPMFIEQGNYCFGTGSSSKESGIKVEKLVSQLVANNIAVLGVDIRGDITCTQTALTYISKTAHQQGLGNVIGLRDSVPSWLSAQCFSTFYQMLTTGLNINQAVVETRKSLQKIVDTSVLISEPRPFQYWSLIIHFGGQNVTFFKSGQTLSQPDSATILPLASQKLLGFKSEWISSKQPYTSDGQLLSLIRAWHLQQRALSITGPAGSGKTYLVHRFCLYLTYTQKIDYAFYFDFTEQTYTPATILTMVGPIVGCDTAVLEKLKSLCCCFVFDGLAIENNLALTTFINTLLADSHLVIISGTLLEPSYLPTFVNTTISPITQLDQMILAAFNLKENKLVGKEINDQWPALLATCQNNPFLIKKMIPLLANTSIVKLKNLLQNKIPSIKNTKVSSPNLVDAFFQWQWETLSEPSQKMLVLCANIEGILLEMIMVACDQKAAFSPAAELMETVGTTGLEFKELLNNWEKAGFITPVAYGRVIDKYSLTFLLSKQPSLSNLNTDSQVLQKIISQVICEGIRIISTHLSQQTNELLLNHLLINRRLWVKHFERLWFSKDYQGFMSVIKPFEQLLQPVQLEQEIVDWLIDLLSRSSPLVSDDPSISDEAKLCWLYIATKALRHPSYQASRHDDSPINTSEKYWRQWFEKHNKTADQQQLALFQQVIYFLEAYYQKYQCWEQCIAVSNQAYKAYYQYQAWLPAITSLKSLVECCSQLGNMEQALSFEEKILHEIPYQEAPPGFKCQQMLHIIMSRLKRQATDLAEALFDEVKSRKDSAPFQKILEALQADIQRQKEENNNVVTS